VTQVVDIVRGVHAMIRKSLFTGELRRQIAMVNHGGTPFAAAGSVPIRLNLVLPSPSRHFLRYTAAARTSIPM
jgi:hypothetical protein